MRAEERASDLPINEEAEQALLGALLVNNGRLDAEEVDALQPEHFSLPVHGRIFAAIRRAYSMGRTADALTLRPEIEGDPSLETVGGWRYLADLARVAASILNVEAYARTIRQTHVRRCLVEAGDSIARFASAPPASMTTDELVAEAERLVSGIAEEGSTERRIHPVVHSLDRALSMVEAAMKAGGAVTGVSTGLIDLDQGTSGLHPSDVIVMAGRPGMGKTALANTISLAAARAGHTTAFFSLEMGAEQLAQRILAQLTGISTERQRAGRISDDDIRKLIEARDDLSSLPLFIDDTPAASVTQLRLRARALKRAKGLGLIVVDYIQLLLGSERSENRVQELSKITRDLKLMAKEFQVPVLALSQLSRAVEQREDKRPQLSDLRESGSIEQDADAVWFLYRHEYYLGQREPRRTEKETETSFNDRVENWNAMMRECEGIAEVLIEKNRHGARRTILTHFDGVRTAFGNLARQS